MKQYVLKLLTAAVLLAAVWYFVAYHTPIIVGMVSPQQRFDFALGCCAIAGFLCLAIGVEAVARDRLFSPAIDPLSGFETRRLRINKQYLQNTLEQFVLFAIGTLNFIPFLKDGSDMRYILAITIVWILSRYIFWISYHRAPLDRIYGLFGMFQSLVVLGLSVFLFAQKTFGVISAWLAIAVFCLVEALITLNSYRAGKAAAEKIGH